MMSQVREGARGGGNVLASHQAYAPMLSPGPSPGPASSPMPVIPCLTIPWLQLLLPAQPLPAAAAAACPPHLLH